MILWDNKNLCDAGFIINLKNRTDRLENSFLELKKAKILGVERFDAVILDTEYHKWLGCAQSHIEIAKLQIYNNWEYVLYLEDDIVYDLFYNYDILVERTIDEEKTINHIISDFHCLKPDLFFLGVRPEKEAKEKITNFVVKPTSIAMSHAYIGSLKYANFLVNNLKYAQPDHVFRNCQIDTFLTQIIEKNSPDLFLNPYLVGGKEIMNNDLSVMMSVPLIFNQGFSYSDLTKKTQDYTDWVRGSYHLYADIKKLGITPFYK